MLLVTFFVSCKGPQSNRPEVVSIQPEKRKMELLQISLDSLNKSLSSGNVEYIKSNMISEDIESVQKLCRFIQNLDIQYIERPLFQRDIVSDRGDENKVISIVKPLNATLQFRSISNYNHVRIGLLKLKNRADRLLYTIILSNVDQKWKINSLMLGYYECNGLP